MFLIWWNLWGDFSEAMKWARELSGTYGGANWRSLTFLCPATKHSHVLGHPVLWGTWGEISLTQHTILTRDTKCIGLWGLTLELDHWISSNYRTWICCWSENIVLGLSCQGFTVGWAVSICRGLLSVWNTCFMSTIDIICNLTVGCQKEHILF